MRRCSGLVGAIAAVFAARLEFRLDSYTKFPPV